MLGFHIQLFKATVEKKSTHSNDEIRLVPFIAFHTKDCAKFWTILYYIHSFAYFMWIEISFLLSHYSNWICIMNALKFLLLLLPYCDMYIFLSFNGTTTMSMHRSCKRSNHRIALQFPMEYLAWVLAVMISFLMWNFRANIGTLYLLSININHFVHIPTCNWFFFFEIICQSIQFGWYPINIEIISAHFENVGINIWWMCIKIFRCSWKCSCIGANQYSYR